MTELKYIFAVVLVSIAILTLAENTTDDGNVTEAVSSDEMDFNLTEPSHDTDPLEQVLEDFVLTQNEALMKNDMLNNTTLEAIDELLEDLKEETLHYIGNDTAIHMDDIGKLNNKSMVNDETAVLLGPRTAQVVHNLPILLSSDETFTENETMSNGYQHVWQNHDTTTPLFAPLPTSLQNEMFPENETNIDRVHHAFDNHETIASVFTNETHNDEIREEFRKAETPDPKILTTKLMEVKSSTEKTDAKKVPEEHPAFYKGVTTVPIFSTLPSRPSNGTDTSAVKQAISDKNASFIDPNQNISMGCTADELNEYSSKQRIQSLTIFYPLLVFLGLIFILLVVFIALLIDNMAKKREERRRPTTGDAEPLLNGQRNPRIVQSREIEMTQFRMIQQTEDDTEISALPLNLNDEDNDESPPSSPKTFTVSADVHQECTSQDYFHDSTQSSDVDSN